MHRVWSSLQPGLFSCVVLVGAGCWDVVWKLNAPAVSIYVSLLTS